MLFVAVVILYKRGQRIIQNVRNGLFNGHRQCLIEHYALAQARTREGEAFHPEVAYKRLYYRQRRGQNIRALCRKPLYFLLFVKVQNLNHIINGQKVLYLHFVIMNAVKRVLVHHFAYFEKIAERASNAHHLHVGVNVLKPFHLL